MVRRTNNPKKKCGYKRCKWPRLKYKKYCEQHVDMFLEGTPLMRTFSQIVAESKKGKNIQVYGGGTGGASNGVGLEQIVSDEIYIASYAIVNGKCAWCFKEAENLSMWHFRRHAIKDKIRGFILK